jgi:hypothetical protein
MSKFKKAVLETRETYYSENNLSPLKSFFKAKTIPQKFNSQDNKNKEIRISKKYL